MKIPAYIPSAAFFIGGAILGGLFMYGIFRPTTNQVGPLRLSQLNPGTSDTYIDPLLALAGASSNIGVYAPLRATVQRLVDEGKRNGEINTASVYLNDLVDTSGFVISPDEQYSPASLLKVPTMMAYYKLSESRPDILNDELIYTGATNENKQEHLPSPTLIAPGRYTVDELINYMIRHSDNNAADLLVNHLNNTRQEDTFNNLMRDLGITHIDLTDDFITIRAYSLFFRVLYNSTYLSRDNSERALKLLGQSDFAAGLDVGVPNSVVVAHKFGEFTQQTSMGQLIKHELHDCGIIYYPHHPYMLCVMTKGNDFSTLESFIASVSQATYTFVASQHPAE